jgi:monoamine oxidase
LSPPPTRRTVLIGVAAAAALSGCAGRSDPLPPGDRDVDVIVVGAGIAGLAAAHVIITSGRSCAVLEARDRVGGRIWTSTSWPDLPVDLGASWIHGSDGNPVYREVVRLGIPTTIFDVGSSDGDGSSVLYSADGRRIDEDPIEKRVEAVVRGLERVADTGDAGRIAMRAGLDDLPPRLRDLARQPEVAAALAEYAGDYGATTDELALSAVSEEDSFPGAQRVFPAGYGQLVERLAADLPLRLGVQVTGITLAPGGPVVVNAGSEQWRAAKVILTASLGVLKSGAIRFDPPLPASHARAIGALGMGRFEKLILRFPEAFWDDVDQIQVVGQPAAPFTAWYNLNRVTGRPALMALNGGAAAGAAALPVPQQTAAATDLLDRIYPGRFQPPLAAQASNWWADEFSRGSYSFTAVGSGEDDRIALAEPIEDRLWLAGEAAHPTRHSTVHGAYASGEAAARQVCA